MFDGVGGGDGGVVDDGVGGGVEEDEPVTELDGVPVADDDGVPVAELDGVPVTDDDGVVVGVYEMIDAQILTWSTASAL